MDWPDDVIAELVQAGRMAEKYVEENQLAFRTKEGDEVVTALDLSVHSILKSVIESIFKDAHVLSEEGHKLLRPGVDNWIIDPIDGTANLGFGPDWSISIGVKHADGSKDSGFVYFPMHNWLFTSIHGELTTTYGLVPSTLRNIRSANRKIMMVNYPSRNYDEYLVQSTKNMVDLGIRNGYHIRTSGCLSYDMATFLLGKSHMVFNNHAKIWDFYGMKACLQTMFGSALPLCFQQDEKTGFYTVVLE